MVDGVGNFHIKYASWEFVWLTMVRRKLLLLLIQAFSVDSLVLEIMIYQQS